MLAKKKLLAAIAAMSENRVIGLNNTLPWHLPADLQHFKEITTGHTLVMGRKTFASIGRPLPNRNNIVISRNPNFSAPGCLVVPSIEEALRQANDFDTEVFIVGGAQIFAQTLPFTQRIFLTVVHHQFDGDAFFPELNNDEWKITSEESHLPDEKNQYAYTFYLMERE